MFAHRVCEHKPTQHTGSVISVYAYVVLSSVNIEPTQHTVAVLSVYAYVLNTRVRIDVAASVDSDTILSPANVVGGWAGHPGLR